MAAASRRDGPFSDFHAAAAAAAAGLGVQRRL